MGIFHPFCKLLIPNQPTVAKDVWTGTQGLYLKINPAQANWAAMENMGYGNGSRDAWDSRLQELGEHASFKGVQISVPWGIYEKGVSGGDFSNLKFLYDVLDDLALVGKYAILQIFEFREFRNSNVSGLPLDQQYRYLLPEDLNSGSNLHGPVGVSPRVHTACDWAYAYTKNSLNPNTAFGYNLKLYKSALRARLQTFYSALANYQKPGSPYKIKDHPALLAISSTESVNGPASFTGPFGFDASEGASARAMINAKTEVILAARSEFPDCMFMQDMAYPNDNTNGGSEAIDYPGEWATEIMPHKLSLSTSNAGNWWTPALNRTDSGTLGQGGNRYLADFVGDAPIFAQLQGDDFDAGEDGYVSHPIGDTADYLQRYEDLYTRLTVGDGSFKYAIETNYIIFQREHPQGIWTGGTTVSSTANVPPGTSVPSFKTWWINKMDTLPVGKRSTGGLNTTRPTHVSMNN